MPFSSLMFSFKISLKILSFSATIFFVESFNPNSASILLSVNASFTFEKRALFVSITLSPFIASLTAGRTKFLSLPAKPFIISKRFSPVLTFIFKFLNPCFLNKGTMPINLSPKDFLNVILLELINSESTDKYSSYQSSFLLGSVSYRLSNSFFNSFFCSGVNVSIIPSITFIPSLVTFPLESLKASLAMK